MPSDRKDILENLPPQNVQNFVDVFQLLLKIDKRVNPHLYK